MKKLANSIRALAIDAIETAKSGHPGMVLGMADIAAVLWHKYLRHNPGNPIWVNRDRFVLSNGHGSMLLYALLHLTGYDLSIDDLKNFRQLHSKTPGHPEYGITPGVETTTGPLGQGMANAVGMALASKILAAQFNKPNFTLIDNYTYCFVGDGCLMEGISHEASSLAGTLGLGKLIVFWDNNNISIDGDISGWNRDNIAKRFASYNWQVIDNIDGHNTQEISTAIETAKQNLNKPTLICCKTVIGLGSKKVAGTAAAHGAPLGLDEAKATKDFFDWHNQPFAIPENYYDEFNNTRAGEKLEQEWNNLFNSYKKQYPELASEFTRRLNNKLPDNIFSALKISKKDSLATRKASQNIIEQLTDKLPELIGGSADLSESSGALTEMHKVISIDNFNGNYVHYGVREFAMSAIINGISLYGSFIPYGATFLTFADYGKNAVRMAALMRQRAIFVYSHDSIALGEDGPTHQPIEHINMLRLIPNLMVWRPADSFETAVAWQQAIANNSGPTSILLTRQGVPNFTRTEAQLENIHKGAYILYEPEQAADAFIIATGSEVQLAVEAAKQLLTHNKHVRVISMPCMEVFLVQSKEYQDFILPQSITNRLAIEAGSTAIWYKFVDKVIGIDEFGASAPANELLQEYNITVANIKDKLYAD